MFYTSLHRTHPVPEVPPVLAMKQDRRLSSPAFFHRTLTRLLLATGCLFSFIAVEAQVANKCLVLLKNDETTVAFPLTEQPKIIVDHGQWGLYYNLIFETQEGQLSFFAAEELNKLEIKDFSGVNELKVNNDPDIRISGKELIVVTSVEGLYYSLTDMNGRALESRTLPLGSSIISLSGYPSGIYIIAVGGKTIKVRII